MPHPKNRDKIRTLGIGAGVYEKMDQVREAWRRSLGLDNLSWADFASILLKVLEAHPEIWPRLNEVPAPKPAGKPDRA